MTLLVRKSYGLIRAEFSIYKSARVSVLGSTIGWEGAYPFKTEHIKKDIT